MFRRLFVSVVVWLFVSERRREPRTPTALEKTTEPPHGERPSVVTTDRPPPQSSPDS